MKKSNKLLQASIIVLIVCSIDLVSKTVAQFLGFEVSFNNGISLSFFQSLPVSFMVLVLMILLVTVCIVFQNIWKENILACGLFVGGSLSNIIDRFFNSGVRDWIPVPFFYVQNNLADWAIFLALLLIIYRYCLKESVK